MKGFTQIASTIVAAAVLVAVSSVIQAVEADGAVGYDRAQAEMVKASDLGLTSAADAATLYRRIRAAAVSVTGTLNWANSDTGRKEVHVREADDGVEDDREAFIVTLHAPSAGAILGSM
jgi:UrcA family protein